MPADFVDWTWEELGRADPYWAVITQPRFHQGQLTAEAIREFYATGEQRIAFVYEIVRRHLDQDFNPESALDFGCGVGRLLAPLARRCRRVVGVDVADSMLAQARARSVELGFDNIELVKSDDRLSRLSGSFEFVHSHIVLQHIPPRRGTQLVRRLIELIPHGGVAALHLTYATNTRLTRAATMRHQRPWWRRCASVCKQSVCRLWLGVSQRRPKTPQMQMFDYNLNNIMLVLQEAGIRRSHIEFTDHAGWYGMMIFCRKGDLGYRA
jgi:SAM-dependent methyltransferase